MTTHKPTYTIEFCRETLTDITPLKFINHVKTVIGEQLINCEPEGVILLNGGLDLAMILKDTLDMYIEEYQEPPQAAETLGFKTFLDRWNYIVNTRELEAFYAIKFV